RFRGGGPVGAGGWRSEGHKPPRARRPGRREGRAIRRLDGKEPRPRGNLAASLEFVEAAFEPENVAAVAGRNEDIVGNPKAELLPQFEGEGLGALDKEGLPIVARIKAFAGRGERRLGNVLPRAGD